MIIIFKVKNKVIKLNSPILSKLGLSDLLDQDLSSYEYFQSLSKQVQEKLRQEDVGSFTELQQKVLEIQNKEE